LLKLYQSSSIDFPITIGLRGPRHSEEALHYVDRNGGGQKKPKVYISCLASSFAINQLTRHGQSAPGGNTTRGTPYCRFLLAHVTCGAFLHRFLRRVARAKPGIFSDRPIVPPCLNESIAVCCCGMCIVDSDYVVVSGPEQPWACSVHIYWPHPTVSPCRPLWRHALISLLTPDKRWCAHDLPYEHSCPTQILHSR
jgi:hypothetical protein